MTYTNLRKEGLSNDKKLISPIRPEPYGDRFIRFIESVTKSPEEAAREAEAVPTNSNTLSTYDGSGLDTSRRRSGSQSMHLTNTNNTTLQRNEREALKSERRGDGEEPAEPRVLTTARSPSADRSGGMQGQILPVVEELGEASSTGGRSGRSGRSVEVDQRPRTPAKDYERPLTPAKDLSPNINGNGLRKTISRNSLEKDLPPLPRAESSQKLGRS